MTFYARRFTDRHFSRQRSNGVCFLVFLSTNNMYVHLIVFSLCVLLRFFDVTSSNVTSFGISCFSSPTMQIAVSSTFDSWLYVIQKLSKFSNMIKLGKGNFQRDHCTDHDPWIGSGSASRMMAEATWMATWMDGESNVEDTTRH